MSAPHVVSPHKSSDLTMSCAPAVAHGGIDIVAVVARSIQTDIIGITGEAISAPLIAATTLSALAGYINLVRSTFNRCLTATR